MFIDVECPNCHKEARVDLSMFEQIVSCEECYLDFVVKISIHTEQFIKENHN